MEGTGARTALHAFNKRGSSQFMKIIIIIIIISQRGNLGAMAKICEFN